MKLGHDVGRRRSQENAVAIVTGGEELVFLAGEMAEQGKVVRGCGTESGPGFYFWSVGESAEADSPPACAKACNVSGLNRFIEAGVFDGGSDDGANSGMASVVRGTI